MEGESPAFGIDGKPPEAVFDPARRFIRINGERHGLVEFDFGVGDLQLSVEMMLPSDDFRRFCEEQRATIITSGRECADSDEATAMSWRPSDVQNLIEQRAKAHGDD